MTRAPQLVLAVGNPSRGDDALGPALLDQLAVVLAPQLARGEVELLTDFQLQIEHALDVAGRARVLFVDASVRATAPYELGRVHAQRDASVSSHAMSPAAVLDALSALRAPAPEAWVLAIRGERFELGEPLSDAAVRHLAAAVAGAVAVLAGEA